MNVKFLSLTRLPSLCLTETAEGWNTGFSYKLTVDKDINLSKSQFPPL